ncbi:hypothetical protein, partial [Pseudonocardia spirodelae]
MRAPDSGDRADRDAGPRSPAPGLPAHPPAPAPGGTPDGEQPRLIAVDVLADARVPQVAGAVFAL